MVHCFTLYGKKLMLEDIIFDFNGIPVYMICSHNNNNKDKYYIAYCPNPLLQKYILVKTSKEKLSHFVNSRISARGMITSENKYYEVYADVDNVIENDIVQEKDVLTLDYSELPDMGLVFRVYNKKDSEIKDKYTI